MPCFLSVLNGPRLDFQIPSTKEGAYEYVQTSDYIYSDIVYLSILVLRHLLFEVTLLYAQTPSTDFASTSTGNRIIGAANNETTEGSKEDENSFFLEKSIMFEMDRLETVPFDDEVEVD
jgi:hypothetical protein